MKINDEILAKTYEEAAIEQLVKEYTSKHYFVERQAKIGNLKADLIAKKDNKIIVFEFKSGKWSPQKALAVDKLRNFVAHKLKGEFKLILVNPPRKKEISIEGIENLLFQILLNYTSQTDDLATHVTLDEVTDVDIDSIEINKDIIDVTGTGNASYELQYGSDSDVVHDDGLQSIETFPFSFRLYLGHDLKTANAEEIDVDTSSFYE